MRAQPPDHRPPMAGATARAEELWGGRTVNGADSVAARDRLQDIVRRFAPSVALPSGDYTTHRGRTLRLLPVNVALIADTLRMDVMKASPYELLEVHDLALATVATDSLLALLEQSLRYESDPDRLVELYFDFPGRNPREWWDAYAALRTGPDSARWSTPTVYAHPFLDPEGRLVIQYWYLYPFNDFVGNHEGDWEHVNVVPTPDLRGVAEVQYYFHRRSMRLPQNGFVPEIVGGTHPVVYVGGRMYHLLDYPIRLLAGDRNEGSHAHFPYPGEWDNVAGMGGPESVKAVGRDSSRWIAHDRFDIVLLPEPTHLDFRSRPELLREWSWFLLPVRFGFPAVPSLGSEAAVDVGNRSPFGPSYHVAWNRNAPGHAYPDYRPRRIGTVRAMVEDLLQPWYYPYIFRRPRYADDTPRAVRAELASAGIAPDTDAREKGIGSTLLGASIADPAAALGEQYGRSTGISLVRNLWVKARRGMIEASAGYQRFPRTSGAGGALYVYPITASVAARMPEALFRPYATLGGGVYGWESRVRTSDSRQLTWSGWSVGWTASAGLEYYLRSRVALDVALRYHASRGPDSPDLPVDARAPLRFWHLYIGHYLRF